MTEGITDEVDRRQVLKYVGSAGAVALAGCLAEGTDEHEGDEGEHDGDGDEQDGDDHGERGSDDAGDSGGTSVRILHDTHLHGSMGASDEPLNIANYFGLMRELCWNAPDGNAFVLGNGDDLHTSVESSVFDGAHITSMFNASPIAYDTFGNHEFDDGPESLRENVANSEFTWLSANVLDERTGEVFAAEEGARRYAVEETDGVRFGFTGLAPADTPEVTSVGEHVTVLDPVSAAEDVVTELRDEGADVVVLLSHLASPVAEELVAEVDGIDVAVGDHASMVYEEPAEVNDTVLSFVGDEFDYVGQIDLQLTDEGVADYSFERHDLEALVEAGEVEPHAEIQDLLDGYESELEAELGEVIGETTVDLDVRTETVRSEESNFGNWLADVMREDVDADVAIQNGGGIRSDQVYEAGEITRRMIVDILPFPNLTTKLAVSGSTLREAIELGVSTVEDGHGRFPQVSGMSYAYDPDAPAGDRVESVVVGGEPLDPDATYELATNDFVAGGGDGYEMLAESEVLVPSDEGTLLSALAIETIEAREIISPEVEGRIETV